MRRKFFLNSSHSLAVHAVVLDSIDTVGRWRKGKVPKLGVMAHSSTSRTGKSEAQRSEFKASLSFLVSYRPTWTKEETLCFNTQNPGRGLRSLWLSPIFMYSSPFKISSKSTFFVLFYSSYVLCHSTNSTVLCVLLYFAFRSSSFFFFF